MRNESRRRLSLWWRSSEIPRVSADWVEVGMRWGREREKGM